MDWKLRFPSTSKIFLLIIMFATLSIGIGYAAINSITFDVSGDVLATAQDGIFITDYQYMNSDDSTEESISVEYARGTTLSSIVTLEENNENSEVSLKLSFYNSTDYDYMFTDVFYDDELLSEMPDIYSNLNITYSFTNDQEIISKNGGTLDVIVTFKYDNVGEDVSNVLNSILNFEFKKLFYVKYDNIVNNGYPTYVAEGENLTVNFTEFIKNLAVKIDGVLQKPSTYSYNSNNVFTLENVSGNVVIMSCIMDFANNSYDNLTFHGYDVEWNAMYIDVETASSLDMFVIPITFLDVGSTYEIEFSVDTDGVREDDLVYLNKYYFGNYVSSTITPVKADTIVWHTKNNTLKLGEKISFTATAETMYWVWDLSLFKDFYSTDWDIYDISLRKISTTAKIYGSSAEFSTKGSFTKEIVNDHRLKFSATGGSGCERINIPIKNLTVGKTYRINFAEFNDATFRVIDTGTVEYYYGFRVQTTKNQANSCVTQDMDWIVATSGRREDESFTFTATATTMYWVWEFGKVSDSIEYNYEYYNFYLEELD